MRTSRFEVLPLKFLMHFKDGATSYLHPVLMDGFYPHSDVSNQKVVREAAELSLRKGVPLTPDSNQGPSKSCRLIRCATAAALLKFYVIGNPSEAELLLVV